MSLLLDSDICSAYLKNNQTVVANQLRSKAKRVNCFPKVQVSSIVTDVGKARFSQIAKTS